MSSYAPPAARFAGAHRDGNNTNGERSGRVNYAHSNSCVCSAIGADCMYETSKKAGLSLNGQNLVTRSTTRPRDGALLVARLCSHVGRCIYFQWRCEKACEKIIDQDGTTHVISEKAILIYHY